MTGAGQKRWSRTGRPNSGSNAVKAAALAATRAFRGTAVAPVVVRTGLSTTG
jgi:hypothetical protein